MDYLVKLDGLRESCYICGVNFKICAYEYIFVFAV